MSKNKEIFNILNKIDVGDYIEKKGGYNYLSWSNAVTELLKVCPDSTWVIHEYLDKDGLVSPYMRTESGCYVKITLTVNGIDRTQIMPVWDHRYKTIAKPDGGQVNTAIQRCLAKVISLHGLGLYIYNGEDLPEESKKEESKKKAAEKPKPPEPASNEQLILIKELMKGKGDDAQKKLHAWVNTNPTMTEASEKIDMLIGGQKTMSFKDMKDNSAT